MRTPRALRAERLLPVLLTLIILLSAACGSDGTTKEPDGDEDTSNTQTDDNSVDDGSEDWNSQISYNGVKYKRRNDLKTVLFMGVDNTATSAGGQGELGNNGRADAIMLFILDSTNKTDTVLMISRDTMTEVDIYDGAGNFAFSGQSQINMQYAYGNSALRSCFLMKRTVSELLYGARVDYHFALTMDGIETIVDTMGGITLTMPEDYTYIDPAYTSGATVTMDGAQAEHFIRYRDLTEHGSNEERVDRQSWFMHAIFSAMRASGHMGETLERLIDVAEPYLETDVDADTIDKLASYDMLEETVTLPGSSEDGGNHDEFYVDEAALQELIIELFYAPEE